MNTPSQKPTALKWVKGISIFQIVVGVLACVFFIWLFNTSTTSDFVRGMQQGVADRMRGDVLTLSRAEASGTLAAGFAFALIGPALTLVAVARQSKGWTIASLIFNAGSLITSFSPLTLAVLILMLQRSSREYLHLSK